MKSYNRIILLVFVGLCGFWAESDAQDTRDRDKSSGMPAYPFNVKVKQSNGDDIVLKGKGDRMIHWFETEDGRTVLQNEDGDYVYAELDEKGDLCASDRLVSSSDVLNDQNEHEKYFFSSGQIIEFETNYYPQKKSVKSNPSPFPSQGSNDVLVLLAEFPDKASVKSQDDISSLMNDVDYNGTGSFRDYYLAASYGALDLQSTVLDWVQVSENMSYYGSNDEYGYDLAPHELVREALDLIEAQGFDFSQFDNDNDGYVDEIIVFHAGFSEQYIGSGDTCIWSHAYHLGDLSVSYDGVILDNYIIGSELYGKEGDTIAGVGTVVHEFAHSLAIPDLYDIDYEGSGGYAFDLNFWDLMAAGGWNNLGKTPAGINAWLKEYMGWMTIPEITEEGSYTLNNAYENKEAYRINTPTADEYFILENRQWIGFDEEIPGYGMMIYHVDMNYEGWETGYINMDPLHQGFDLEEADNIRDSLTIDGDAFPGYDNVTVFNDTTVPSSNMWNGQESYVNINNIAQDGYVITFNYGNAEMDEVPVEWEPDPSAYSDTAFVNAQVMIVNDTAARGYLSAFVDGESRGVAPITYYPPSNTYVFELEVYSNQTSGEEISFRYYDPVDDSTYLLMDTLVFVSGAFSGNLTDPIDFNTPVSYSNSFVQGWNWFSLNVKLDDMSPGNVITSCVTDGDYLKSQTSSTTYYGGYGWFGSLEELNTRSLYLMKATNPCGIDISGVAENPKVETIDLVEGWNWLAYQPTETLAPGVAMASLNSQSEDYLKSQTASTTYYGGYGWFGSLNEMNPGEGYMIRVSAADVLEYPTDGQAKKGTTVMASSSGKQEIFDPYEFEFSGSLTASVLRYGDDIGAEGDILYAFSGEECRGMVTAQYFEPADAHVFPIMVYSRMAEGEELTFKYYSRSSDSYFDLSEGIRFSNDMVLNNAFEAMHLSVAGEISGVELGLVGEYSLNIGPNPGNDALKISYEMPKSGYVKMTVFDLLGRQLGLIDLGSVMPGSYVEEWSVEGLENGTYLLQMECGGERLVKKFIYQK